MLVVKLGGSAISDKRIPFSYRRDNVVKLALKLKELNERVILVHGGGSFAHYAVAKYGVGDPVGVSLVKQSLLELKRLIVRDFASVGVPLYPVETSDLVDVDTDIRLSGYAVIRRVLDNGMIPLLHGDVVVAEKAAKIVSGDEIAYLLAERFRPRAVIFVMDVDGVYTCDPKTCREAKKLYVIDENIPEISEVGFDVTGGLRSKISYGIRIARLGVEALFCGVENFGGGDCTRVSRTEALPSRPYSPSR